VIRLLLGPDGHVEVAASPAAEPASRSGLRSVLRSGGLWRHKWADRTELAALEGDGPVPLFLASDGTVLETSRGNVFLLLDDGTLVTAPLRDDLLPGVTRQALLDRARDSGRPVQLREFGMDELCRGAAFWTSSLSGAVAITSIDDVALPRRDAEVDALSTLLRSTGYRPIA
jgi:para-aminobenzoate synthetase/4-amino-4-deoxychorismate lyase